ncbi:lipase family protein [Parapedobacter deserti]|uniref:Lipase family protein n=1 Tax=Parapedobacter deserti TaxID=1912957 RepID=A0ABV7JUV8_9SPHI
MKHVIALAVWHLFWVSVSSAQSGTSHHLQPGFDPRECDDLLQLNAAFLDTVKGNRFEHFLSGYRFVYRSENVGLDNAWDLWIRTDSIVAITLRGTTANPKSILADFFCAMSPARGQLVLSTTDTFNYQLAAHEKAAVHTGFLIGFGYTALDMQPKVDSLYRAGYRNFLVTGHSQGGSLCYYVSAWLYYLEKNGRYPGLRVKTYASAAPKVGNMYFAYDYDNIMRSQWAFSIVNTADAVPEMPLTTQQVDVDMNEPNPILALMKRFDDLPFFKRIVLKRAFNRMRKAAAKSSEAYQRYLGGYTGKLIQNLVPGLALPETANTTYFVRPGVPITLVVNESYFNEFRGLAKQGPYYHHNPKTYRYLLRQYYPGLTDLEKNND